MLEAISLEHSRQDYAETETYFETCKTKMCLDDAKIVLTICIMLFECIAILAQQWQVKVLHILLETHKMILKTGKQKPLVCLSL